MNATQQFTPGTVLLGKYRIDRKLGEGGMAVVAQATHLQLQERVAIKCLLPEIVGNREVVQRFLREAQAAVKLKGEHVARMIDVGTLEGGEPYIVMEYLEGVDLSQLLEQRGSLPASEATDFMLQACEALAEAHSLGIVHRDIKPANFFIARGPDGTPRLKVLDFGISKAPVEVDQGLTRTNAVMGTPAYMSPEQMRSSRDVDGRTDIWALGVVLHELLAGARPWPAETFSELCIKVATDPPEPLPAQVPAGMRQIVARCLEKQADARFQSCADLAASLAPFASHPHRAQLMVERIGRMLGVTPTGSGAGADPLAGTAVAPATGTAGTAVAPPTGPSTPTTLSASVGQAVTEPPAPSSKRGLGLAIGGVVAAAVAVALIMTLSGGGDSDEPTPVGAAGAAADDAGPATATSAAPVPADAAATAAIELPATDAPVDAGAAAEPDPEPEKKASSSKRDRRRTAKERPKKKPTTKPKKRGPERIGPPPTEDPDDILGSRN